MVAQASPTWSRYSPLTCQFQSGEPGVVSGRRDLRGLLRQISGRAFWPTLIFHRLTICYFGGSRTFGQIVPRPLAPYNRVTLVISVSLRFRGW